MNHIPLVIRAEYCGGHRIRVTFDDGVSGVVDFTAWLSGQVFEPLKDAESFAEFSVEAGTVCWPNGADIAPETLYREAKASHAA